MPELRWPALPSASGALVLAVLEQIEAAQWWPPERIRAQQRRQLDALLHHAYRTVPFHRGRLDAAGWRPGVEWGLDDLARLPVLGRRTVQREAAALASVGDLRRFGGTVEVSTSGSTGEPVKVRKTALDQIFWQAMTLRDHRWHRRDVGGRLATIRVTDPGVAPPPGGVESPDWGSPASEIWETGPAALLDSASDIAEQAHWLLRQDPDYLLVMPSSLAALLDHCARRGERPGRLREVRTLGETVSPALRAACRERWGVPLVDSYSAQELGYLALQCPQSGRYHVMAENLVLEVLDEAGRPCAPGEVGRVVVTALHGFAMPLVRYDMGDLAEQGAPCPCGRGLPTLNRVLGRTRNLVTLPNGERRWPVVGFARYGEIAPVRQFQLVQRNVEEIELRLVVDRPLAAGEELRLGEVVRESLGHPFRVSLRYFAERIPRGPGGKFEEFVSEVEAGS